MDRRELLRTLGAAGALALLPSDAKAIWVRVAQRVPLAAGLSDAQLALVAGIADTILPESAKSPSATAVRVPAFVNVIVSDNFTEAERTAFVAGLAAIEDFVRRRADAQFATAGAETRMSILSSLEALPDRRADPSRTYWRLKQLVLHGYFTSERVMKDVLHTEIMPGRFDGSAPMPHA